MTGPVRDWLSATGSAPERHAAYHLLSAHDPGRWGIDEDEAVAFLLDYYGDGIVQGFSGEQAPKPYVLGHDFQQWFLRVWPEDPGRSAQLRDWLADLARHGGARTRDVVVLAVLEHLFETPSIRAFFRTWQSDGGLADLFAEATVLAEPSS